MTDPSARIGKRIVLYCFLVFLVYFGFRAHLSNGELRYELQATKDLLKTKSDELAEQIQDERATCNSKIEAAKTQATNAEHELRQEQEASARRQREAADVKQELYTKLEECTTKMSQNTEDLIRLKGETKDCNEKVAHLTGELEDHVEAKQRASSLEQELEQQKYRVRTCEMNAAEALKNQTDDLKAQVQVLKAQVEKAAKSYETQIAQLTQQLQQCKKGGSVSRARSVGSDPVAHSAAATPIIPAKHVDFSDDMTEKKKPPSGSRQQQPHPPQPQDQQHPLKDDEDTPMDILHEPIA